MLWARCREEPGWMRMLPDAASGPAAPCIRPRAFNFQRWRRAGGSKFISEVEADTAVHRGAAATCKVYTKHKRFPSGTIIMTVNLITPGSMCIGGTAGGGGWVVYWFA